MQPFRIIRSNTVYGLTLYVLNNVLRKMVSTLHCVLIYMIFYLALGEDNKQVNIILNTDWARTSLISEAR